MKHGTRNLYPKILLIILIFAGNAMADEPTPGYNTKIPKYIMTPDKVETRIGTLEFFDGIPTKGTAALLYDNLDFLRGVETFLNGIPATSVEGIRLGMERLGLKNSNQALIFDQLMDSNPLFLTGNTSTVYYSVILDLKKDGPTVVEIPPGVGPGTVNDAFFRFVVDMGTPGPDKGKGGKYLILPPDFEGDAPDGYFAAKSSSYMNWLILRGFLVDGKPDFSSNLFRTGVKVYSSKNSTLSSIVSRSVCSIPNCAGSLLPSVSRRANPLLRTIG
jgi:hypothetical protein